MRRWARKMMGTEESDSALQYAFLAAVLALAIMGSALGFAQSVSRYFDTAPPAGVFD